ncbi:hypothetical protein ACLOJK_019924 [Asimina triloba]
MPAGELSSYPSAPAPAFPIVLSAESEEDESAWLWSQIKVEARRDGESEPALASYLHSTILSHSSLERSLSFHLGNKLCSSTLLSILLYDLFLHTFSSDASIRPATVADLHSYQNRTGDRTGGGVEHEEILALLMGFLLELIVTSTLDGSINELKIHRYQLI